MATRRKVPGIREYDSAAGRQAGNFPQAFSHVALINTALNLSGQSVMDAPRDKAGFHVRS